MAARYAAAQEAGAPIAADFPSDEARNILEQTTSLIELLSAGFDDAHRRADTSDVGEMLLRPAKVYARAFDGLNRLIALADFHVACAMGDRP